MAVAAHDDEIGTGVGRLREQELAGIDVGRHDALDGRGDAVEREVSFELPPRRMAMGIPAKVREGYEVPENNFDANAEMYAANAAYYRTALRRIDQE